jgi:hypothetical protein
MADIDTLPTSETFDAIGEDIRVLFNRTSPTTGTITWTLPSDLTLYDGLVATLKTSTLNASDVPTDGTRYSASQNLATPIDVMAGGAIVVAAIYGDKMTTSVNVINLDPAAVYFASGHAVTNTLQYFTRGRQSYPLEQATNTFAGDIPTASSPPLNPSMGQVYYNNQTGKVSMWAGGTWVPAGVGDTIVANDYPTTANVGQFFYHLVTQKLYCYDGSGFTQSNTASQGVPVYAKPPGDDGTYDERAALMNVLKRQLGWPTICVELNEEHFNVAIENALQEFRRRCDNAYTMKYFFVGMHKAQDIYFLNDPVVGTNAVVDVVKIHRVSGLGLVAQGENGIYGQSFLQQLYQPGVVDLTSIYLMSSYAEQFSQIFAGEIGFRWNEATRQLQILRRLNSNEKMLIEATCERTEQELLVDRYSTQWIQGWALSEAKMMLGHIRSKYGNLPGAGGGITLNGSEMLQSAAEDQTELLRQIMDFEVGNGGNTFGNYSFLMG